VVGFAEQKHLGERRKERKLLEKKMRSIRQGEREAPIPCIREHPTQRTRFRKCRGRKKGAREKEEGKAAGNNREKGTAKNCGGEKLQQQQNPGGDLRGMEEREPQEEAR